MTSTKQYPKALPYLFLTEMWERFGFYVVQGLLVLYMTKAFGFSDDQSYTISGTFTALAYISPMIGGLIADRILGFKMCILWGGIFLSAGYALLALSSNREVYLALATIIVGNGLFKPNISSLLGALYPPGDTGRDAGFTIFYVGINLGAFFAGISSGAIKDHFGWHAGFALASIGLLIGLCTFALGLKWGDVRYKQNLSLANKYFFFHKPWLLSLCILTAGLLSILLQSSLLSKWLLPLVGIFLLFFVFILAFSQEPVYRNRLILLNILIIAAIVYWTFFLQIFFSANLFIDRLINKQIAGVAVPTTAFYSLESVFVILLGPLFAWSWQTLNQNKRNPSTFIKFVWAIFFVGLGFLTLTVSTFFSNDAHLINPLWIVFSYLFITIGELLLSPIGLAAVTLLSPPRLTGMMMGIWFVALGFGGEFAGFLATLSSVPKTATTPLSQLPIYRHAFFNFSLIAFTVALLLFFLQLALRKKLDTD
ncbi:MAG: hypothetical protein ACD_60C00160G0017 [uncultured bacterium]|nr:MAG: hypothetical protein ACD_60C00160G0017 [uncultured bacterium]